MKNFIHFFLSVGVAAAVAADNPAAEIAFKFLQSVSSSTSAPSPSSAKDSITAVANDATSATSQ